MDNSIGREAVTALKAMAERMLLTKDQYVVEPVLYDPRFEEAPGGIARHHAYPGGLAKHTLEVAELMEKFCIGLGYEAMRLGFIASVMHDYGKVLEYEFNMDGSISRTPFAYLTRHLVWSWHFFLDKAKEVELSAYDIREVGHAMLAHHGLKEWGSPVEPHTTLAFLLHAADMLSMQKAGGEDRK